MVRRVTLVVAVVTVALLLADTPSHARPGRGGGRGGPPARNGPPPRNAPAAPHANPATRHPGATPRADAPRHDSPPIRTPPARHGATPPKAPVRTNDRPSPAELHKFMNLPQRPGHTGMPAVGALGAKPRNNPRWTPEQLQSVRDGLSTRLDQAQGPKPFTAAWYLEHPNAWKITHPYAPAAAMGFVTLAGWVRINAAPVASDYSSYTEVTNYYPAEEGYAEHQQEVDRAAELAATDQSDDAQGPWMSLGVFGLLSPGRSDTHLMLQLAANQQRLLRGTYFDVLSESSHPVRGSIDPETQQAAWTVGANEKVVYQTDLSNLTGDSASLLVHFSDRQTQKWTMVRIEPSP
jgi:hypothetical protein